MERARLWWMAARPFSFTASVVPVVIGTLLAAPDHFVAWKALVALVGAVLIHAGTNFINDYFDDRKGVDGPDTLGQAGAIQRGEVTPRAVFFSSILCFAGGGALGLVLAATSSWELVYLGVASILAGFLYTGWPFHLAYVGLGEVTVFVFMGPIIVLGAYFVQIEAWHWEPVVASLPIAFLVTAILHANNLRDIENDRTHGKRTLSTLIGRRAARFEMYGLLAAAYVSLVIAVLVDALPWMALIAVATIPLVRPIVQTVMTYQDPRRLNLALLRTAMLHMQFGAVLAVGLGVHWFFEAL